MARNKGVSLSEISSLPNNPNYELGADSGSVCDTLHLGIKKELLIEKLIVYPNPVQDELHIIYKPDERLKQLEIFDVNGKVVLNRSISQWSQKQQIDVSKFRPGIYLCKLKSGSKYSIAKFVKLEK